MKKSEYETAMKSAVEAYPGVGIDFEFRGRHKAARLSFKDRSYRVFYPATPSDSKRGILNLMRDLRRGLREIGAAKT